MAWDECRSINKNMKLGYKDRQLRFFSVARYTGISTRLGKIDENGDSILIGRTNMYSWVQRIQVLTVSQNLERRNGYLVF